MKSMQLLQVITMSHDDAFVVWFTSGFIYTEINVNVPINVTGLVPI